jgi:hypothetical protein
MNCTYEYIWFRFPQDLDTQFDRLDDVRATLSGGAGDRLKRKKEVHRLSVASGQAPQTFGSSLRHMPGNSFWERLRWKTGLQHFQEICVQDAYRSNIYSVAPLEGLRLQPIQSRLNQRHASAGVQSQASALLADMTVKPQEVFVLLFAFGLRLSSQWRPETSSTFLFGFLVFTIAVMSRLDRDGAVIEKIILGRFLSTCCWALFPFFLAAGGAVRTLRSPASTGTLRGVQT